jgi:hypothetical protein
MRLVLFLSLFASQAFAVEVVTLEASKSVQEITLVTTDETLNTSIDKHFAARACRVRYAMSAVSIRENYFYKVCRAEVIQFLLNNGYRPDQFHRVFTK